MILIMNIQKLYRSKILKISMKLLKKSPPGKKRETAKRNDLLSQNNHRALQNHDQPRLDVHQDVRPVTFSPRCPPRCRPGGQTRRHHGPAGGPQRRLLDITGSMSDQIEG